MDEKRDKRLNQVISYLPDDLFAFVIERSKAGRITKSVSTVIAEMVGAEMDRHRDQTISAWNTEIQELRSREVRHEEQRSTPSSVADFTARARQQPGPIRFHNAWKDTEQG